MTVRNIKKSLAGVEDIATGIGTLQQERGIVHRVNVFPSSYSYIDMQQYEGGDFFRLYGSDTFYTDYHRNPSGAVGIPATAGGYWQPVESVEAVTCGNDTNGAYIFNAACTVSELSSGTQYMWPGSVPYVVSPGTDLLAAGFLPLPNTVRLGTSFLWVDSTGKVRVKTGLPSNDTDGTIVGTQA